jgi:hypothetical protein
MGVYLTYDNLTTQDGSGAQVQRIFAIYSLAKKLKIEYLHSQILEIDFNPGDGVSTLEEMLVYKNKLNESLSFLSTERIEDSNRINLKFQNLRLFLNIGTLHIIYYRLFFWLYKSWSIVTKKNYVFVVRNPYPLMDKIPNSYWYVKNLIPVTEVKQSKEIFSIHLHLFRTRVSKSVQKERYTEDCWYFSILDQLSKILESRAVDFEIVLHTDIGNNAFWEMPSGSNKQTVEYWKAAGVKIDGQFMATPTLDVLDEFKKFKNLRIVSGIDAIEAWKLISRADVFIMGKSSFSFIGAIYNNNGIIITPKFFIPKLNSWYLVKEVSNLNLGKVPNLIHNSEQNIEKFKDQPSKC